MAAWPIDLWNEWSIEILVLLSFTLQVVLLLCAGIRRREASSVLRILLWLVYQLADITAISALGLLSLTNNTTTRDHQLVAFWAPFLLLHLGGPDNITAYALEDSQLWMRHFLILAVQVTGAVYVIYQQDVGSKYSLVLLATMLMFVAGFVKFAERTWALNRGNMDTIRSSLNSSAAEDDGNIVNPKGIHRACGDQFLLEVAHSQLRFCKLKLVDSSVDMNRDRSRLRDFKLSRTDTWKLMEMELSLLYDILYTKAAVAHTWIGYLVRFTAPLTIAASFVLFHLHFMMSGGLGGHIHGRFDVAITYALLAGAFFMEVTALLGVIGSTWALAFLCSPPMQRSWIRHVLVSSGRWHRLRHLLLSLGWLDLKRRRWSGTVGQYNLLHLCTRDSSGSLVGTLAGALGQEDWWNRFHYSGSILIPEDLKKDMFDRYKDQMSDTNNVNALGLLRRKWGELALEKHDLLPYIRRSVGGVELQEDILIWHIATDVFLANRDVDGVDTDQDQRKVRYIVVLSNYMMFLVVKRPYLLPGLVLHRMYDTACDNLVDIWRGTDPKSFFPACSGDALKKFFWLHDEPSPSSRVLRRNKLAKTLHKLQKLDSNAVGSFSRSAYRVEYGANIAAKLLKRGKKGWSSSRLLDVILDVWMDFLFYTANRCSRESYAKKLNSGAELTAILWLMGAHFHPDVDPLEDEEM